MRIVHISDTHRADNFLTQIPEGDVLIHSGDIDARSLKDVAKFNLWLETLPHKHKIFVPGNHDFFFEEKELLAKLTLTNATVLVDESIVIDDKVFYGSPWTPRFGNWAFMQDRGKNINQYWEMIPLDTDVLITHGPPMGILDKAFQPPSYALSVGCEMLLDSVKELRPKYHLFGHIHESYGIFEDKSTIFINSCLMNEDYYLVNKAHVFDL